MTENEVDWFFEPIKSLTKICLVGIQYHLKYMGALVEFLTVEDQDIVEHSNYNHYTVVPYSPSPIPVEEAFVTDHWKGSLPYDYNLRESLANGCSLYEIAGEGVYRFSVPPDFRDDDYPGRFIFRLATSHDVPSTDPDWDEETRKAHSWIGRSYSYPPPTIWYNSYSNTMYIHPDEQGESKGLYVKSKPYKVHLLISNNMLEHLTITKMVKKDPPSLEALCAQSILQTYFKRPQHIHPITWNIVDNYRYRPPQNVRLVTWELNTASYQYYIENYIENHNPDVAARHFNFQIYP